VLEPLVATHRAAHPKADLKILQKGLRHRRGAHRGQLRKSGDPYITHPLAVATILAELGMDTTTLVAALLHDTVEDTGYTLEDVKRDFDAEVAHLVDGVTKLDKVKYGDAAEAETIRKMIVAMARDPRVLVIKLADRLHNMRTLRFLRPDKQERIARQTLEVLAPLAHRLGMNTVKWELEDLAFATLYPKRYDEIVRLVAERAPSRDTYLARVVERVSADLRAARVKATVTGRPKHYYSIYQKMIVRGRDFTDIYDLVGIRILVDSVRDCYATLGVVHATWQPVPAGSRTTSRCRSSTCTSRCTRR
jgi:GTP pyrophosphokinase